LIARLEEIESFDYLPGSDSISVSGRNMVAPVVWCSECLLWNRGTGINCLVFWMFMVEPWNDYQDRWDNPFNISTSRFTGSGASP